MPKFLVRTREVRMVEYVVVARGPNDAANKVEEGHDSAEMIYDYDLETEVRYVEPYEGS